MMINFDFRFGLTETEHEAAAVLVHRYKRSQPI